MKSAIQTLRLYHGFGNGTLSTLPAELMVMLEREIARWPREFALDDWNRKRACYDGTCDPLDHYQKDSGPLDSLVRKTMSRVRSSSPNLNLTCVRKNLFDYFLGCPDRCQCQAHQEFHKCFVKSAHASVHKLDPHFELGPRFNLRHDCLDGRLSRVGREPCQPVET